MQSTVDDGLPVRDNDTISVLFLSQQTISSSLFACSSLYIIVWNITVSSNCRSRFTHNTLIRKNSYQFILLGPCECLQQLKIKYVPHIIKAMFH
jgi:hypothetical protein